MGGYTVILFIWIFFHTKKVSKGKFYFLKIYFFNLFMVVLGLCS